MKTINANVYRLNELDPKVKEGVLERCSQLLVEGHWFFPIVEGFREDMEYYGFIEAEPYFSGFYSQGDGACFICDTLDTDIFIRKLYEEGHDISEEAVLETKNMSVIIQKVNTSFARQYDHENTVAAYVTYEGEILSETDIDRLESVLTEWVRERSRKLYQDLEKFYEELTHPEAVEEYLQDSYFFEDGRIADRYILRDAVEETQENG